MRLGTFFGREQVDGSDVETRQWRIALAFAIGLCLATGALVWLAYVATRQWQRGTELLQERRAAEALALAHAGLLRDMKGAWVSLLVPVDASELEEDPPYGLLHRSVQAFAKFPYIEGVVVAKKAELSDRTYAFVRSDRRPGWVHSERQEDSFPAVMLRDPVPFRTLIDQIQRTDASRAPFTLIETTIDGVPYQIIAHTVINPNAGQQVTHAVAMAINLDWVQRNYFAPILTQISSIGGLSDTANFSVTDDAGHVLARTGPVLFGGRDLQRSFPLMFLEPSALRPGTSPRLATKEFSVHVQQTKGAPGAAAFSGALHILLLVGLAALASIVALLLTVRALRGRVRLAVLKSEFVSAVTHELKTPLVTIRLIGDTLARGRYASTETIQEHAKLLSQEALKLGDSIDHLLTYARYSEAMSPSAFVDIHVSDIVEDAVDRFRATLAERDGTVEVNVPAELPQVRVESRAAGQALEIVLDNAIKYTVGQPMITVAAQEEGPFVAVTVTDRGLGIHRDDLPRVRERFFRGRNALTGGSGLGLAIADRILEQNGGALRVDSQLDIGTTVKLLLRKDLA